MFKNKNLKKLGKVLVVLFLCSEMSSSAAQKTTFEEHVFYYEAKTNSTQAFLPNVSYQASIRVKEFENDDHLCLGTVISPSAILTTAQCVYNYNMNKPYHPSELKVVLHSISFYRQPLIFSVTHSYPHEQFDYQRLSDNIAILMLDRDIPKAHKYIKQIALPHKKTDETEFLGKQQDDDNLKVISWLETKQNPHLSYLSLVNVSRVSDETCLQYYGKSVYMIGMLCIASDEPLGRNYGSLLFSDNVLVGLKIVSIENLSPAIYTDVSHYAEWIHSVIGNGSSQNCLVWGTLGFLLLTYVAFKSTK